MLLSEDARDRFIGQEGSSTGRYGAAGYIGLLNRQVQYFSKCENIFKTWYKVQGLSRNRNGKYIFVAFEWHKIQKKLPKKSNLQGDKSVLTFYNTTPYQRSWSGVAQVTFVAHAHIEL